MFPSPPPSALGAVIGPNFDIAFINGVPIERIDLSGYGANIFSRWFLAKNPDVGITQVALDAFNGRTAYERILMTVYLIPCFSRMVRTITLERHGSGAIVRWDSGWEPTTPGLFEHPKHTSHKCAVGGIYNIREVRDTDYIVTLGDGTVLQAVYYDGDIAIENPVRGADSTGRVPARRHLGFIQQLSLPATPPPGPISAPVIDAAQLRELFDLVGPLGGPVDCQTKIGSSQHEMNVTSILAANAGLDQFSVGPCGSPVLKGPGQWSVARVNNNSGVVEPIDPTHGIPLIRSGAGPYRWADPADLFTNNPVSDYAFLFSSGAQRVLFPRPKINNLAAQITSIKPPLLADPYALLKAPSLFPPSDKAIPFGPQAWGLDLTGGVLRLSPSPFTVTASTAPGGFNLLNTSSWSVDLAYKSAEGAPTQFVIDSAADWAINSTGIRQALTFPIVGEVMTIVHKIEAPSAGAESFPEPQVLFSGALDAVVDVLRMLREWAPNLPAPLTVDVSFSGSTFRLSAVADFNIEDADGNAIDCGMGKLKGDLKIGAELSVEVFKRTTNGAVFFEVTGSWQQEVFPLIYGGGLMRFALRAGNSGQPTLELDACVVGSIGGDLIPGLVSLEATAKYGYFLFTNPILPGFMVGIEGRAKLVSGLLGFKLGIEGRIGIARKGPLDLQHYLPTPRRDPRCRHGHGRLAFGRAKVLPHALRRRGGLENSAGGRQSRTAAGSLERDAEGCHEHQERTNQPACVSAMVAAAATHAARRDFAQGRSDGFPPGVSQLRARDRGCADSGSRVATFGRSRDFPGPAASGHRRKPAGSFHRAGRCHPGSRARRGGGAPSASDGEEGGRRLVHGGNGRGTRAKRIPGQ
jgi:hypothetical protein